MIELSLSSGNLLLLSKFPQQAAEENMCPLTQVLTWWGDKELKAYKLWDSSFPSIWARGCLTPWAPGLTTLAWVVSVWHWGACQGLSCSQDLLSVLQRLSAQPELSKSSVKWTACSSSAHSHLSVPESQCISQLPRTRECNTVWNKGLKREMRDFLRGKKNPTLK